MLTYNNTLLFLLNFFFFFLISTYQYAINLDHTQNFSTVSSIFFSDSLDSIVLKGQWQPIVDVKQKLSNNIELSSQIAFDVKYQFMYNRSIQTSNTKCNLYRCWLRVANTQSELRIGLQRLNFGSAQILRPLQWFDHLEPTDITEQTSGVQALLYRYYFLDNSNLWFWVLRGEGKPQGITLHSIALDTPALGMRSQTPLPVGEIGVCLHYNPYTEIMGRDLGSETKLGWDYRMDSVIGFWIEHSLSRMQTDTIVPKLQTSVTQGMDYTITIGNGLYFLCENNVHLTSRIGSYNTAVQTYTTAIMLSYPLGLLDTALYYYTYTYDGITAIHNLIWRRSYNNLSGEIRLFYDWGKNHTKYNSKGANLFINYIF